MEIKIKLITKYFDDIGKWFGYLSAFIVIIGYCISYVSKFFEWGNKGPFLYLQKNKQTLWISAITVIVVVLWVWISKLHKQFVSGFSDNFFKDLRKNWDFIGPWRVIEKGILLVNGSDEGGITKTGTYWENYTFKFRARIIKKCLGIIVRAQDLDNYYMFQLHKDRIRPHRRVSFPSIKKKEIKEETSQEKTDQYEIKYEVGWEIFDNFQVTFDEKLDDWFDVKIIVRGESIFIYINDRLVFQKESFLKISSGKVGFRNVLSEEALVKKVKVILEP